MPRNARTARRGSLAAAQRFARAVLLALALAWSGACGADGEASKPAAASAAAADADVPLARIEGEIELSHGALLRRAAERARATGGLLLLELDTPGGSVEVMRQLVAQIDEAQSSGLRVIGWVEGEAASAGALIAMACDLLYLRSSASMGSATPIQIIPGLGLVQLGAEEREKIQSNLRAQFRAVAERHGRPPLLAEAMIGTDHEVREVRVAGELRLVSRGEWDDLRESGVPCELVRTLVREGETLSLTGAEAVALRVANGLAEDRAELLAKVGRAGANVELLERRSSEVWAEQIHRYAFALLAAAAIFGLMELKAPGFGLPGALSLAALAAVLFARWVNGTAQLEHLLIAGLGAALVALEVLLLPGTMWLALSGVVLLAFGVLGSGLGPAFEWSNEFDRELLFRSTLHLLLLAVAAIAIGFFVMPRLSRAPLLGGLVLDPERKRRGRESQAPAHPRGAASGPAGGAASVGALGCALTPLRPVGKVELEPGSAHEASAVGLALEAGARVRVLEVQGGRLLVEAAELRESSAGAARTESPR